MGFFDDKTEAATPKKRDDARRKGQVAKSREIVSVAVLIAAFYALRWSAPRFLALTRHNLEYYLTAAMQPDRTEAMQTVAPRLMSELAVVLMPLLLAVSLAGLVANVAQTGPMLVGEGLKVNFGKINPMQGLKRLFSPTSLVEMVKAILKVGLVFLSVYLWMRGMMPTILQMIRMPLLDAGGVAASLVAGLFWRCLWTLIVIAALDYAWQLFHHESQLKMTKQEVRDEIKQQEGSPEIKGQIRRRQREMSRNRMLANLPKADVVITNPTHYAVALRYDPKECDAPQVIALGQRLMALKIRELAKEHGIPIVENPPLARALFAACDVDDLVPPELYQAVAEVLAYVYRLSGRGLPGA